MEMIEKIARLQYREAWTNCRITTGIVVLGVALALGTVMLEQSSAVALVLWAPIGLFGLLVGLVTICSGEVEAAPAVAGTRSYAMPQPPALPNTAPTPSAPTAAPPIPSPPTRAMFASTVPAPRLPVATGPSVPAPTPRPPVAKPPISVDTPVPIGGFPVAPAAAAPEPAPQPVTAAPAPEAAPKSAPETEPTPEQIGQRPAALEAARDGTPDDLKLIKGVGPKLETLLHSMGFYHFDQIASWTEDEVAWVDENLEGFKGRVSRDDWVAQAKLLAAGLETEFSKKAGDGDVD